ncbi:MAG: hypothetical protein IJN44_01850 [Clostridia bacterium]|nr:hypothetical protein [Clostridia bacterium]
MKTIKKMDGRESKLSSPPFLLFSPDALHPVGGILPPARGAVAVPHPDRKISDVLLPMCFCVIRCRIQLAKLQSSFAKSFCVFLGGETTIPQALRASSLYIREPFSHVPAGTCLLDKIGKFRRWVQGWYPAGFFVYGLCSVLYR